MRALSPIITILAISVFFTSCGVQQKLDKGQQAFADRDYTKAITLYEKVLKKEPSNHQAIIGLGQVHFARKNYKQTIRTLNRLRTSYYNNSACTAYYQLGESYFLTTDYKNALQNFQKVIANCQRSNWWKESTQRAGAASFNLGVSQYNNKHYQSAITYFKKCLEYYNSLDGYTFKRADELYFALANSYSLTDQYDAAIRYFTITLNTYPNSIYAKKAVREIQTAYYNAAVTHYNRKKYKKAQEYLSILEVMNSSLLQKNSGKMFNAKLANRLENYSQALSILETITADGNIKASELTAEKTSARFGLGTKQYHKKNYRTALKYFNQLDTKSLTKTEQGTRLFYMARSHAELSNRTTATDFYTRFVNTYNTHPNFKNYARTALAYAERLDNTSLQITILTALDRKYPSEPYRFSLAKLYGQKCDSDKAMQYLNYLATSSSYTSYIGKARKDIRSFACLTSDRRFHKWLSGIRRYKLEIEEAYCADSDAWAQNDLFVIVSNSDKVLLCTEVVDNRNRARFTYNEVIFECGPNSSFLVTLMEEDDINDNDKYLEKIQAVRTGTYTVTGSYRSYVKYNIELTTARVRSDRTSVPVDMGWTLPILAAGAIMEINNPGISYRFLNCLVQSFASRQITNPVVASAVAMAIDNIESRKGVSINSFAKGVALNLIAGELRTNGYPNVALLVEAGTYLDCVFNG